LRNKFVLLRNPPRKKRKKNQDNDLDFFLAVKEKQNVSSQQKEEELSQQSAAEDSFSFVKVTLQISFHGDGVDSCKTFMCLENQKIIFRSKRIFVPGDFKRKNSSYPKGYRFFFFSAARFYQHQPSS
jgi:hypothetical protein